MEITVWYLEQTTRPEPVPCPDPSLLLMRAESPTPEFSRFLYTAVGGDWYWRGRLPWTWDQWCEWLANPGLTTWVLYHRGTPAGYAELIHHEASDSVEINSFGLLPSFMGRGFGRYFLTETLERAWQKNPRRVWLHTCSLDSPHALANYKARGMRVYEIHYGHEDLPERPYGPWPGARD